MFETEGYRSEKIRAPSGATVFFFSSTTIAKAGCVRNGIMHAESRLACAWSLAFYQHPAGIQADARMPEKFTSCAAQPSVSPGC